MLDHLKTFSAIVKHVLRIDNGSCGDKNEDSQESPNSGAYDAPQFALRKSVEYFTEGRFSFGLRCWKSGLGLLCDLDLRSNSEIAGHFLNHVRGNNFLRLRIGGEQGIIADDVHQPGNPL